MEKCIATVAEVKQKLIDQQYKCSLTGWPLSPDSFCLDHVIPMAEGGDDSIGNLECVHPLANTAKGTMGKAEFVMMCEAVAAYSGSNRDDEKSEATLQTFKV